MALRPDVIHDGSGYKLRDDQMSLWQNIEYVMVIVSELLGSRQLVSLNHQVPHYPSRYGYTRSHTQEKFARKAVLKSLNAFQRLLAYCSYCMTGVVCRDPVAESRGFYSGDYGVSDIYKALDPKQPDLHILTKNLLSSLQDITTSRNFTGIVINHTEGYDYCAVEHMVHHGVPVYVSWPDSGSNPYINYHQHQKLKDFYPTPEHFAALESHSIPHELELQSSKLDRLGVEAPELILTLEEGELIPDPNDPLPEEEPQSLQPPYVPVFNNAFFLRSLLTSQFSVDRGFGQWVV